MADGTLATGVYSQALGANPIASRLCGRTNSWTFDEALLEPGTAAFYLAAGAVQQGADALGADGSGTARIHHNPCPAVP